MKELGRWGRDQEKETEERKRKKERKKKKKQKNKRQEKVVLNHTIIVQFYKEVLL